MARIISGFITSLLRQSLRTRPQTLHRLNGLNWLNRLNNSIDSTDSIHYKRILDGQRFVIYGDGDEMSDCVCAKDVARANALALKDFNDSVQFIESIEPFES